MQRIVYYLVYPILFLISILPFRLLYLLSDGVYVLMYYVIGYRKKVVAANLKLVYPEKTEKERLAIQKKFYRHLCDIFLEMIKTMSISTKEMQKRFSFTNLELLEQVQQEKNVLLLFSHYASWEWSLVLNTFLNTKGYGVYKKINNPYFDKLVRKIRAKYGTTLMETKETVGIITQSEKSDQKAMYGFISDQSPMAHKAFHWNSFMGITVPVYTGAEMLAKRFDLAVLYLNTTKVKRGHYKATFEIITKTPNDFENYTITDTFMQRVEKQIHKAPEYYFWTHKRWKHKDEVPKEFL